MIKEEFEITGMSCSHCIKSVDEAIKLLPVDKYEVKLGLLYVEYNPEKIGRNEIINAVSESGYDVVSDS